MVFWAKSVYFKVKKHTLNFKKNIKHVFIENKKNIKYVLNNYGHQLHSSSRITMSNISQAAKFLPRHAIHKVK